MSDNFVGLHVHSEGSFLDGLSTVDMITDRTKELGQKAVAITDHGECNQHYQFEKACKAKDIHPIFGMEGYLSHNIEKQRAEKDPKNSHIVLLAENQKGLSNLWTISSLAYQTENFYYKPLADWEMFKQYSEGLIATSACMLSFMARAIVADDFDQCRLLISKYQETFGEDNFFLELHTWQLIDADTEEHKKLNRDMSKINQGLVQLSKELSVPTVVVNDAHYAWPEQSENHGLVWSMSTNQDQTENKTAAAHMMSDEEIVYWLGKHGISRTDAESAIATTSTIAERCQAEIPKKLHIPILTKTKEEDLELFNKHIEEGFQKKVIDKGLDPAPYRERVEEEVGLIVPKDFHGYFNIVADYCKFAKQPDPEIGKEAWLVGPSRGSAGGSLVAYLMDITELDPLKYDLLFGRFIDPGRKSFPDIDLDFPQSKRDQMKEYLIRRYGRDRVCGIGTLSRLQPRGCLRDLGRALNIPYDDVNTMSKIIEKAKDIDTANVEVTWDEILDSVSKPMKPWMEKYPYLFQKLRELTGLIRQSSAHAAGLLISDESLLGQIPLRTKAGNTVTQFEFSECEELGFIKFDVLGIRHLDTLTETRKMFLAEGEEFDPNYFYDFTDEMYRQPDGWDRIGRGETLGVFQLETPGMTAVGKDFKPRDEVDVADLISVNRPGVVRVGMLGEYLKRRAGEKPAVYVHPLMEPILGKTFGVVVYQEQVMKIVQSLAGYTISEADKIRKIMGKMLYEKMKLERPEFIERCVANPEFVEGCGKQDPREVAFECWKQIEAAGIYSFNQGHAQGYGLICAWGSYMAREVAEYLTSCLITDPEKSPRYIKELRKNGIDILPPDVNESEENYTLTDKGVRYGLNSIKHVGEKAQAQILQHRPFDSLEDFLSRVEKRHCNARVMTNLISIGAMDTLGDRASLLRKYYESRGELDKPVPDFTDEEVVQKIEVELIGSYITCDPMAKFIPMIEGECIQNPEQIEQAQQGEIVTIGGQVSNIKEHNARNGLMCFLEISWNEQVFPITIFADKYAMVKPLIKMNTPMVCQTIRLEQGVMLREAVRLDWL